MNYPGLIVCLSVAAFLFYLKWKVNQVQQERFKREQAEETADAMRDALKSQQVASQTHETKTIEILRGVSDARASELLSTPPESPANSYPAHTENGSGRRKALLAH